MDGGIPDAGPDASLGPRSCSLAGGVDAGMCDGGVCTSSVRAPAGACTQPDDLALACGGQIASVVAACAEDDVLGLGTGRSVATCARRDATLGAASPGCIDCYVQEVLCAAQNCFVPCLAGFSEECRLCRLAFCGEALQGCSGLYVPAELTNPAGDAGI